MNIDDVSKKIDALETEQKNGFIELNKKFDTLKDSVTILEVNRKNDKEDINNLTTVLNKLNDTLRELDGGRKAAKWIAGGLWALLLSATIAMASMAVKSETKLAVLEKQISYLESNNNDRTTN